MSPYDLSRARITYRQKKPRLQGVEEESEE
jgi:hypothetical protein